MKVSYKKQQKQVLLQCMLLISFIFSPSVLSKESTEIQKQRIYIGVGEQRFLNLPDISRFSIGNPNLIRSLPLSNHSRNNELLIKGIQPGFTDITVWKSDGSFYKQTIQILEWNKKYLPNQLLPLLSSLEKTEMVPFEKKILLHGKIDDLNELKKIHALKKAFPTFILDETYASEALLESSYDSLKRWTEKSTHLGLFKLERSEQSIFLTAQLKPKTLSHSQLTKELENIFPLIQISMDQEKSDYPSIQFQIYLIEIQKNFLRSIGIQWPQSLQAQLLQFPRSFSLPTSLELSLNHLENKGSLKVLSQPQLVVRSPGEAELFSGGELPLVHKAKNQTQTTWKPFGLKLKLKVHYAHFYSVRIEIETEMSSLDPSISLSEIPGIQSNRMKTHVESEFNKPLLLSGLIQQKNSEHHTGLPFLQDIPVLGALFKSQDFMEKKSELVVILLPTKSPHVLKMRTLEKITPDGPIPPPRQWIDPFSEEELRKSLDYPWNVFQENSQPQTEEFL